MRLSEDGSVQRRRENRTRIDIMTCILRKTQIPARKTQIMISCSLSTKQAADLLRVLQFNDLVEKEEESRIFQTTEKGYEFLTYYDRLSQLLQPEKMETPRSRLERVIVGNFFRNHYSTKQK